MRTLEEINARPIPEISIQKAFSDGWALVNRHLGFYILGGLVATVIGAVAGMIPFVGSIASNLFIGPGFMASAIFITWHVSRNIPWVDFGEIFKGFSFLTPVVISTLIAGAASIVLALICFYSLLPQIFDLITNLNDPFAYRDGEEIMEKAAALFTGSNLILMLAFFAGSFLLSLIWCFKYHFIVIYKMDAWPAMEMSRKVATRNILPLAGLFILLFLLIVVSILPCFIGLLFSLPLLIGATYSAFAQITGCDEADQINSDMFDFMQNKPDNQGPSQET